MDEDDDDELECVWLELLDESEWSLLLFPEDEDDDDDDDDDECLCFRCFLYSRLCFISRDSEKKGEKICDLCVSSSSEDEDDDDDEDDDEEEDDDDEEEDEEIYNEPTRSRERDGDRDEDDEDDDDDEEDDDEDEDDDDSCLKCLNRLRRFLLRWGRAECVAEELYKEGVALMWFTRVEGEPNIEVSTGENESITCDGEPTYRVFRDGLFRRELREIRDDGDVNLFECSCRSITLMDYLG